MLTGLAYIMLALMLIALIAYQLLIDRTRDVALLDRRIASFTHNATAAPQRPSGPLPVPDLIAPLLAQAQIEPTTRGVIALSGGFAAMFLFALIFSGTIAALAVVVLPGIAIVLYVQARARQRIEALIDALPFYVDAIRQMLSVGNSLPQALIRALPASPRPVQVYFASAARRIELGAPISESMQQVADRLHVPEISMLAAAIRVNVRFGGPMTAILTNLGQIIRERLRIKRELRSATAEIKVSTWVLIGMPVVAMVLLLSTNPDYVSFFLEEPRGRHMGLIALALQGFGALAMNRLMRLSF